MKVTVDIRTILSCILLWLPIACSGPQKDPSEPKENKVGPEKLLITDLQAFNHFNKAEPFYRAGTDGADSAAFYYDQLLKERLAPDQKLLIFNRLGYVKFLQEKYDDSYDQFLKGTRLISKISPDHLKMVGMSFSQMGAIHYSKNQTDSALYCFLEAERIFKMAKGGDKLYYYYLCLERIAFIYHWDLEDYTSAEKYFVRAHEMFSKNLIQGQDSILLGLRYSMASMYRLKREFDKALIYAVKTRNLADSLIRPRLMENSRALLSSIYRDQNGWELARALNSEAIQINISRGGDLIDLALYYNSMSFICLNLKQYTEALDYCRKVSETLNKISAGTSDPEILDQVLDRWGFYYDFRGTIYQETGRQAEARRDYAESLRLRKLKHGDRHKRVAQINQLIGKHFLQIHSLDSALYFYQQSLITGSEGFNNPEPLTNPFLQQIENNVELIDVLREKASLLKLKFDQNPENLSILRGSVDCLILCDSLVDYIWNSYTNEVARLYLEDTVHSFYEQAVKTAYELYQYDSSAGIPGDIYHFMESSRYRYLSDNLTSIQAYSRVHIPEALTDMLRETEFFINYYNRGKNEFPEKTDFFNQQLFEKNRQKERLIDSISRIYPEVASIKNLLKSESLDSLKEKILLKNSIVVQYFSGGDQFCILSTDGKRTNIRMVHKDSALSGSIDAIVKLPDCDPLSRPGFIRFAVNSLYLYEKLLKPSLAEFKDFSGSSLIIIPDGPLNQISFDALIRSMPDTAYVDYKVPDYLVNHFTISYAFSSGMLTAEDQPGRSFTRKRILAMSYGISDQSDNSFANLEGTNRELDAIKGLGRGRFLKDMDATESAFKKYAPGYEILHLALHGQAGTISSDSTMLIFRKAPGDNDDGALLPEELLSLSLEARLVVLSSCESGTGKYFRGEGIYSMARAFANAGCPSLVTTLWRIPDGCTVQLMTGFYKGLKKKLPPDQALRKSKVDYLRQADPNTSHPRFWASIIPLGKF